MKLKVLVDDVHLQLILVTPIPSNPILDFVCGSLSGNCDFYTKTATWPTHGLDIKNSLSLGVQLNLNSRYYAKDESVSLATWPCITSH